MRGGNIGAAVNAVKRRQGAERLRKAAAASGHARTTGRSVVVNEPDHPANRQVHRTDTTAGAVAEGVSKTIGAFIPRRRVISKSTSREIENYIPAIQAEGIIGGQGAGRVLPEVIVGQDTVKDFFRISRNIPDHRLRIKIIDRHRGNGERISHQGGVAVEGIGQLNCVGIGARRRDGHGIFQGIAGTGKAISIRIRHQGVGFQGRDNRASRASNRDGC